ncbi:hypothetical protein BLOT_009700 [Blomia tropicalis]|nr:hypothetical protein BLOT_009700 [Blomia tropicalis]
MVVVTIVSNILTLTSAISCYTAKCESDLGGQLTSRHLETSLRVPIDVVYMNGDEKCSIHHTPNKLGYTFNPLLK